MKSSAFAFAALLVLALTAPTQAQFKFPPVPRPASYSCCIQRNGIAGITYEKAGTVAAFSQSQATSLCKSRYQKTPYAPVTATKGNSCPRPDGPPYPTQTYSCCIQRNGIAGITYQKAGTVTAASQYQATLVCKSRYQKSSYAPVTATRGYSCPR